MATNQYEVKIVTYNPTSNEKVWASDIYRRRFDSRRENSLETSWERVYCGPGMASRFVSFQRAAQALESSTHQVMDGVSAGFGFGGVSDPVSKPKGESDADSKTGP